MSSESSTFASEITTMKHCYEYLMSLRYTLKMMYIIYEDPQYIQKLPTGEKMRIFVSNILHHSYRSASAANMSIC